MLKKNIQEKLLRNPFVRRVSVLVGEPKGPISINIDVLSKFGLDLERDFELVYESVTPAGAGGYDTPRQQLFYYSKSESIKTYCNVH